MTKVIVKENQLLIRSQKWSRAHKPKRKKTFFFRMISTECCIRHVLCNKETNENETHKSTNHETTCRLSINVNAFNCLVKQQQDHRRDADTDLLTKFSNILLQLGNFTPQ